MKRLLLRLFFDNALVDYIYSDVFRNSANFSNVEDSIIFE